MRLNLAATHQQNLEDFLEKSDYNDSGLAEDYTKRQIACKIFGMSHLWWAEEILHPASSQQLPDYDSKLSLKNAEKLLLARKIYLGWNDFN